MSFTIAPDSVTVPSLGQLQAAKKEIRQAIKRHKGTGAYWIFGSVARGEATVDSDYDLLVEFLPGASYFDLAALEIESKTNWPCPSLDTIAWADRVIDLGKK